ncbi:unnamed protein product [Phytophthora fragariaefolia]|uniref:Unnamed protein product n=1 Tax=Phytophthora fragariaefolia TaxID=1490495 RepID=A0A9W6U6A2_9STRA|nr:unnamed protein product [Phytophthora fragariaefolia]
MPIKHCCAPIFEDAVGLRRAQTTFSLLIPWCAYSALVFAFGGDVFWGLLQGIRARTKAPDADFLQLNGIMHIINCVPRQVPNIFQQSLGLSYTACDLDEVLRRPFFDLKNREFTQIIHLVDRALEKTESVLVHSLNGINRSPCIMIGYLMVKYCWGLDKAHEFVMTKRSDMKLHESYIDQLCSLETQIQEDRPARATERQLYEWGTNSADPKTDEVVLIHTFLNSVTAPDPSVTLSVASSRRNGSARRHRGSHERRLTWIDQTPEMVRRPVDGYADCFIANTELVWIYRGSCTRHYCTYPSSKDKGTHCACRQLTSTQEANAKSIFLVQEVAAEAGLLATRVAFADLPTSKYSDPSGPEFDLSVPSAAEAPLVHSNKRLHSFSAPKRTEVLDDEASTSPSTISEEADFMPEETLGGSNPRYLRETLASINSRPRRLSSAAPTTSSFRSSSNSSKRVSLPASGRSFSSSAILGSTGSKEKTPTSASKGVAKRTGKPVTAPGARSASSTGPGGRVFFSVDFPPPQSSTPSLSNRSRGGHILTGSARRSVADPLSQQSQTSMPSRPRTAPPRSRKDVETKDLLQSKKVELGGFSRIAIDPKSSYRMSSVDYGAMDSSATASSSATRGVRRTSTSSSSGTPLQSGMTVDHLILSAHRTCSSATRLQQLPLVLLKRMLLELVGRNQPQNSSALVIVIPSMILYLPLEFFISSSSVNQRVRVLFELSKEKEAKKDLAVAISLVLCARCGYSVGCRCGWRQRHTIPPDMELYDISHFIAAKLVDIDLDFVPP